MERKPGIMSFVEVSDVIRPIAETMQFSWNVRIRNERQQNLFVQIQAESLACFEKIFTSITFSDAGI